MSAPNVEQFIDLLVSIPAEGYDNAFAYVMSEWTKQQGKSTSCTCFALARYPVVFNVNVFHRRYVLEFSKNRRKR